MNVPTSEPEVIETERLVLLPLRAEHADELAAVLDDRGLHTFIGGSPLELPELRARYERLVAGSPDPTVAWHNWAIWLRREDCLVGTAQATVNGLTAEIAWVVGTQWQGRGIASEAARAAVGWLERHDVRTVLAHIHPEHEASARVAAAAGLEPTEEQHDGETRWQLRFRR
jgi:RimJ/RimL family protein N-acetyltransferase